VSWSPLLFYSVVGISALPSATLRIGWLHFRAGFHTRRLISGFVVLCFSLFGQVFRDGFFCVSGAWLILTHCFWLSVPAQLNVWKESSPEDLLCVE